MFVHCCYTFNSVFYRFKSLQMTPSQRRKSRQKAVMIHQLVFPPVGPPTLIFKPDDRHQTTIGPFLIKLGAKHVHQNPLLHLRVALYGGEVSLSESQKSTQMALI